MGAPARLRPVTSRRAQLEAFFAAYARRSDDALREPPREDVEAIAESFAPYVVGANPSGVFGGGNDETLRRVIPQGFARYREIGGKAMRLAGLEITELDPFHAMAAVDWEFDYERRRDGRAGTIRFRNLYFLSFASGQPKIFAWISPDEEQAMREHGLV
jgi:hypothetical protein